SFRKSSLPDGWDSARVICWNFLLKTRLTPISEDSLPDLVTIFCLSQDCHDRRPRNASVGNYCSYYNLLLFFCARLEILASDSGYPHIPSAFRTSGFCRD